MHSDDAKWMISKYLSVGRKCWKQRCARNEPWTYMKLGLVNIHPSSGVIHVFLVSVEFSSTEENFAKTMMMSRPWQKSVICSCIWVWTTVSPLATKNSYLSINSSLLQVLGMFWHEFGWRNEVLMTDIHNSVKSYEANFWLAVLCSRRNFDWTSDVNVTVQGHL